MMTIVSSRSLELIPEQKEANDHVGSRGITWCRLLLDVVRARIVSVQTHWQCRQRACQRTEPIWSL
jgi:hypothetical protein